MVNQRLREIEKTPQLKIGYYPVDSEVHVSLTVLGQDPVQSDTLFRQADEAITAALGDVIYGHNLYSMGAVVGELLRHRGLRLAVAESCTGGLVASKITEVAGSSQWFVGGVITYSNDLKERLLGVDSALLAGFGAVSAQVARAMAQGVQARTSAEVSVAITGIAGPSGGTPEKPVGTVHFGLSVNGEVTAAQRLFSGSRKEIQEISAQTALDLVRRALQEI
jgi:nicotinamide-nucleotide amidase